MRRRAPRPLLASQSHLGVAVAPVDGSERPHRLITVGDSLTQGFQSFAIHKTDWSWPAQIARAMGFERFTYPTFDGPPGCAGLPFNLEEIVRRIDEAVGMRSLTFDRVTAAGAAIAAYSQVGRYWDDQDERTLPVDGGPYGNLAIWGWDLRDALDKTWGWCLDRIEHPPAFGTQLLDAAIGPVRGVSHANERTALRTLWNSSLGVVRQRSTTQLSAAQAFGAENGGEGVETAVVALGANNALGSVIGMRVRWSETAGFQDLEDKRRYTVWTPAHFRHELRDVADAVRGINAAHTIWLTVPHVTVVPLLRGVGEKPAYSRYFARYTRPWISDADFDAYVNPCLTGDEARAIDSAIDEYNWAIKELVHDERVHGRDWLLVDLCGLLDRVAYRRYLASPLSQPEWWKPMEQEHPVLAPALDRLPLVPDTRFYTSDRYGRTAGGLIALDGVHPTTIGYGLIANEVLDVMTRCGVRPSPTAPSAAGIDFEDLIRQDSLIAHPPLHLEEIGRAVAYLGERVDIAEAYLGIQAS